MIPEIQMTEEELAIFEEVEGLLKENPLMNTSLPATMFNGPAEPPSFLTKKFKRTELKENKPFSHLVK